MDCPNPLCDRKTRKKDLHPENRCMHELHTCTRCEEEVMEQDYEVCMPSPHAFNC
jgi:hypothetical protein